MPWCLGRNETCDQRVLDNLKLGGYAEGVLHAFADEVLEKVRPLVPRLMMDRDNVVSSMCVNLIFRNATIFTGQCHICARTPRQMHSYKTVWVCSPWVQVNAANMVVLSLRRRVLQLRFPQRMQLPLTLLLQ
jgi:hypothetical protein